MSRPGRLLLAALLLAPFALALLAWLAVALARQGGLAAFRVPSGTPRAVEATPATIAHGRYLARIGNCAGCHTAPGAAPYAGGRAFSTPWGVVYSSNLTTHPQAGIGAWSLAEFRHAMRHGVSRNGVQAPVFPYASFARMTDADLDALFAFLATLAPVDVHPPADALRFPASLPGAMTAWRLLYYRPAAARMPLAHAQVDAAAVGSGDAAVAGADDALLQRGRYLVDGIGHCNVCHGARGWMASQQVQGYLAGGHVYGWYAPPLHEAALQRYTRTDLAAYLRHGNSAIAAAYGPMADVVFGNLQYLTPDDASAVAAYLKAVRSPQLQRPRAGARLVATEQSLAQGERLYAQLCADCHGEDGAGDPGPDGKGKYPPLLQANSITAPGPENAVNIVLLGAVPPTTAGNPHPHTMPPFAHRLSAGEVAAVVNFLRTRWGEGARLATEADVRALGSQHLD